MRRRPRGGIPRGGGGTDGIPLSQKGAANGVAPLDSAGRVPRVRRPDLDRINVKDYGATGDGETDDTEAILAALEDACGGPVNESGLTAARYATPIYFPAGRYLISDVLRITAVMNMDFAGAGAGRTVFACTGTGTREAFLAIDGSYHGYYHDFSVVTEGGETVELVDVVKLDWDPEVTNRSSRMNMFERVKVRECKWANAAIAIGRYSPNLDVSTVLVQHCSVVGLWEPGDETYWQYGMQFGNGTMGNVLIHTARASQSVHCRYGVHINNVNVAVDNMELANSEADIRHSGVQPFSVRDCRSEESDRFFLGDPGGTSGTMGVFENIIFAPVALVSDARVMVFQCGGSYEINNLSIRGASGDGAKFYLNAGSNTPISLAIRGCRIPQAVDSLLEVASNKPYTATFEGYVQINNNGLGQNIQNTAFRVAGPVSRSMVSSTASYTLKASDSGVLVDATVNSRTVTLPTAVGIPGASYLIGKTDSTTNTVTVTPAGSETISGSANFVLRRQHQTVEVMSDGANWVIAPRSLGNTLDVTATTLVANVPLALGSGAATSEQLRMANNDKICWASGAGGADVNVIYLNTADQTVVQSGASSVIALRQGTTEVLNVGTTNGLRLAEGMPIRVGTTTGTKIGTATNQLIGFHNATPTVQRAGAAQAAVDTTAATNSTPYGFSTQAQADAIVTLLNEIRAALVEKGIIKGSA